MRFLDIAYEFSQRHSRERRSAGRFVSRLEARLANRRRQGGRLRVVSRLCGLILLPRVFGYRVNILRAVLLSQILCSSYYFSRFNMLCFVCRDGELEGFQLCRIAGSSPLSLGYPVQGLFNLNLMGCKVLVTSPEHLKSRCRSAYAPLWSTIQITWMRSSMQHGTLEGGHSKRRFFRGEDSS